jgi:hypothetical protein
MPCNICGLLETVGGSPSVFTVFVPPSFQSFSRPRKPGNVYRLTILVTWTRLDTRFGEGITSSISRISILWICYYRFSISLEGVEEKVVVFKSARMTRKFQKVIKFEMTNKGPCRKGLKIMLFSPIRVSLKLHHSDVTDRVASKLRYERHIGHRLVRFALLQEVQCSEQRTGTMLDRTQELYGVSFWPVERS